jgi:uncharacterized iron-regulated protein
MTKLDLLSIHKEKLTAAMDALIDAKQSIDKAIGGLSEDIEKIKQDILDELNNARKLEEMNQRHIALEEES